MDSIKKFFVIVVFVTITSCTTLRNTYYTITPLRKPKAPTFYIQDIYDGLFEGYETINEEFATQYVDSVYDVIKEQYGRELLELGIPQDAYERREVVKWALYFARHADAKINLRLRRGAPYLPYIRKRLKEEGMPEALAYLPIIESAFRRNALSRARARGMWQFMRSTARKYGLSVNWWIDERLDPYRSTDAAIRYLKDLYNMFGSWDLALAAYNAGEGRILRALNRSGGDDFFDLKRYLRRETREYVPKFLALCLVINNPEKFNTHIEMPDTTYALSFDTVYVPRQVNISLLAKWAGISQREFRKLNPSFIRWATPPYLKNFPVRIPKGRKEVFYARMKSTPKSKWYRALAHRVRRGETLWNIARKYGVSVYALKRANRIRNARYLRPGQILVIPVGPGSRVHYAKRSVKHRRYVKGGYVVGEGETLWSIAKRFGTTVSAIKRANHLRTSRIRAGDVLVIPGRSKREYVKRSNKYVKSGKKTHTVRRGETLWSIAKRYNTSVMAIKRANGLKNSRLKVGQVLVIPESRTTESYAKSKTKKSGSGKYYRVKRGDTLWKISRKLGVSVKVLKKENNLYTTRIKPGQLLKIPETHEG